MSLIKYLCFLLTLFACSHGNQQNSHTDTLLKSKEDNRSVSEKPYSLGGEGTNKKHITSDGSYYILSPFSDSTMKIAWGNDTIERVYEEPVDVDFAERLSIKWQNNSYLILNYNTGSGTWVNTVLPLNNSEHVQTFTNALCFDKINNLLVTEEFADTILAIHNLKTLATQFVVEKAAPCKAATNEACIETIVVNNKTLYYKWTAPSKFGIKKNTVEKHVAVKL